MNIKPPLPYECSVSLGTLHISNFNQPSKQFGPDTDIEWTALTLKSNYFKIKRAVSTGVGNIEALRDAQNTATQYAYDNNLNLVCAIVSDSLDTFKSEAKRIGLEYTDGGYYVWFDIGRDVSPQLAALIELLPVLGYSPFLLWKDLL